ncbi:MAG TPA: hypothetical protein PKA37_15425 [Planctomycetota bacterium]|nr:hypothetical protein [Planctomycetota bacterium]
MAGFGPREIGQVLRITDALGIHREAVRVPLSGTPEGLVAIRDGKLLVMLPEVSEVSEFLGTLEATVRALPLVGSLKRSADA